MRKWMIGSLAVGLLAVAACGEDAPPPVVPSNPPPVEDAAPPPPPPVADKDGDGIPDDQDKCPDAKGEARPGDKNGCPYPTAEEVVSAGVPMVEAALKAHAGLTALSSDRQVKVARVFYTDANKAVVEWVAAGTHDGDFLGYAPAKDAKKRKGFGVRGITLVTFDKEGAISSQMSIVDTKSLVDQIQGKGRAAAKLPSGVEKVSAKVASSDTVSGFLGSIASGKGKDKEFKGFLAGKDGKDAMLDDVTAPKPVMGGAGAWGWANDILKNFADAKFAAGETWVAGDTVIAAGEWSGTQTGTYWGVPAVKKDARKEFKSPFAGVFMLKDGKIVSGTIYSDAKVWLDAANKPLEKKK